MEDYVTTTAAGKILNVSRSRVQQFIAAGRIQAVKFGRDLFIGADEIRRFKQIERRPGRTPLSAD